MKPNIYRFADIVDGTDAIVSMLSSRSIRQI